jgi:HPt (histidine-containing phosphotransfer) domain-containing protein
MIRPDMLDSTVLSALSASIPAAELAGIYRAFAADLARLSEEFGLHARDGDQEAARRTAHALAGAASGVGATSLETTARQLMRATTQTIGRAEAERIADETADVVRQLEALGRL